MGMFEYMAAYDDTSRTAGRKALALARARAMKRFARFLSVDDDRATRLALVAGDLAETVKQACADAEYDDYEGVLAAVTEHLGGVAVEAARKPKMCPVHREITDISLQQGDPQAGFAAMAQHMFGEKSCRGSWEEGRCNFKPEMATQTYWDNKAEKAEQRRLERQQQAEQLGGDNIGPEPVAEGDLTGPEPVAEETVDHTILDSEFDFDVAEDSFGGRLDEAPVAVEASVRTGVAVPNPIIHGGSLSPLGMIAQKKPGLTINGAPFEQFAQEVSQRMATEGMPKYESIEVSHPHPEWERVAAGIAQQGHDGPLKELMQARRQQRAQPVAKTADAVKTVDVEGTEGPVPTMNKDKWTPENVKFLDVEMPGSPVPTHHQDIVEPVDHSKDALEQTRTVTETQDVTKDSNPTDGGGEGGSWSRSNGASPVTSATDPERNPIRDAAMAEFPSDEDVAAAIEAYQGR